ncbi:MAG: PAS domain S-box protein [Anaerolineae bacterium]|nr:PAS domain S-box protein [Anaerolineae bacterium]
MDITSTKEKLQYQSNILENAADAIIATDLNFIITSWNKTAEKLYGWSCDEVIGKDIDNIVATVYPRCNRQTVMAQISKNGNWNGYVVQKQRDGTDLSIASALSFIKIPNNDVPVGIVAINRDSRDLITYDGEQSIKESLNSRLRVQASDIERLKEELKDLSYSVSHDLRAPLRAISGFAQIITRRYWDDLNEETQHFLNNIVEASDHMDHLINDLLAYSRLGHRTIRYQLVDLKELINQVLFILSDQIKETQARIDFPIPMPIIQTDPTLLHQIFANLIENAIIYRQPTLPPHISISHHTEAGHIVIGIADNGLGIPTRYHSKVFNIFQRLHQHDNYEGNGIGLSLVKKSVKLLHGTISIESNEKQGTTFRIILPL